MLQTNKIFKKYRRERGSQVAAVVIIFHNGKQFYLVRESELQILAVVKVGFWLFINWGISRPLISTENMVMNTPYVAQLLNIFTKHLLYVKFWRNTNLCKNLSSVSCDKGNLKFLKLFDFPFFSSLELE